MKPRPAVKLFTVRLPEGQTLNHAPGQFVMVSVFGVGEMPIVVTSSPSRTQDTFELCIRRVGDVTSAIHKMKIGDQIGIRGPFGWGFPWESFQKHDILFVIGGMGLPPARSLIDQILDNRTLFGHLTILYGAQTRSDFLFNDQVAAWKRRSDIELMLTVDRPDDQWSGNVGACFLSVVNHPGCWSHSLSRRVRQQVGFKLFQRLGKTGAA